MLEQVEVEMVELAIKYRDMALANKEKGKELLSDEQQIMYLKEMTELKLAKEVILGDERKDIRYLITQKKMEEKYEVLSGEMLRRIRKENIVEDSGYDENIFIITEEYYEKVKKNYNI